MNQQTEIVAEADARRVELLAARHHLAARQAAGAERELPAAQARLDALELDLVDFIRETLLTGACPSALLADALDLTVDEVDEITSTPPPLDTVAEAIELHAQLLNLARQVDPLAAKLTAFFVEVDAAHDDDDRYAGVFEALEVADMLTVTDWCVARLRNITDPTDHDNVLTGIAS